MVAKPLILGTGYVAQAYARAWGVKPMSRSVLDYTDPDRFNLHLGGKPRPSVVINCAGFTGRPNIDECEVRRGECVRANLVLPVNLSNVCAANAIPFVHISSGCIYQGLDKREDELPDEPLSFYSRCKWIAEQAVTGYVLRIRMPFGMEPHPRSFLTKIMGYRRLISEENSLTYLPDLADATAALLRCRAPLGVYNVVNTGTVTHREIVEIFNEHGIAWAPQFIPTSDLATVAPRSNCTLDGAKLLSIHLMASLRFRLHSVAKEWASVREAA